MLHIAPRHFLDAILAESAERDLGEICFKSTETLAHMKDEECTELGSVDPFNKEAQDKFNRFCEAVSCQAIAGTFSDQRQQLLTVKSLLQGLEDASRINFKVLTLLKKADPNDSGRRAEKMVWMLAANQASKGESLQLKNIVPKLKACNDFPKPLLNFMQELAQQAQQKQGFAEIACQTVTASCDFCDCHGPLGSLAFRLFLCLNCSKRSQDTVLCRSSSVV